jgi:hypothetical protein
MCAARELRIIVKEAVLKMQVVRMLADFLNFCYPTVPNMLGRCVPFIRHARLENMIGLESSLMNLSGCVLNHT